MKESGEKNMNLEKLEKNVKARRFCERHGFAAAGEKKREEGIFEYLVLFSYYHFSGDGK